ncbi:MAG: nucleotidyltransferase domain-containing protein [Methanophagales archaeon]|nr:nucleotidyltransferase domain-containing protein [Methanophagales archaeon]
MERLDYFKNYGKYVKEMRELVSKDLEEFELYVFGSAIKDDYSVGLSDIDLAIVSDEFEFRKKKLKVYDLLFEKYFDSPFEFHLLTVKKWEFFLRFTGKDFVRI